MRADGRSFVPALGGSPKLRCRTSPHLYGFFPAKLAVQKELQFKAQQLKQLPLNSVDGIPAFANRIAKRWRQHIEGTTTLVPRNRRPLNGVVDTFWREQPGKEL